MTEVEKALKDVYDELVKTRNEIKNLIEASEARLLLKIDELRNNVSQLQKENNFLSEEIENIKRENIKKNIVIFGLNKKREEITAKNLCTDLNELLEVDLDINDFNDIYPLGKTDNCPIKIEFTSNLKKKNLMRNCSKLKGKNISIANDLTQKQRTEYKVLRKHLFLAKQDEKFHNSFIKGNKLYVNGESYAADELEIIEYQKNKPSSAPSTPTTGNAEVFFKDPRIPPETPKNVISKKPLALMYPKKKTRTRSGK